MSLANELKTKILRCDPYADFNYLSRKNDPSGGEIYPIFTEIIKSVKPQLIVEVGTWKGRSAIAMADLLKEMQIDDPAIICVDTWLGSDAVHQWRHVNHDVWGMKDNFDHGYPTMYFQFLANVMYAGHQDIIVPFPNTSTVGAQWLSDNPGLKPGIIYIDACHDEDECYLDISRYWPALAPGGIMIGDDFDAGWYGVICAVNRFAKEQHIQLYRSDVGNKWVLQKSK